MATIKQKPMTDEGIMFWNQDEADTYGEYYGWVSPWWEYVSGCADHYNSFGLNPAPLGYTPEQDFTTIQLMLAGF